MGTGTLCTAKNPVYMGMGTLCTAKEPPIYGHGTRCTAKKHPIYGHGQEETCGGFLHRRHIYMAVVDELDYVSPSV